MMRAAVISNWSGFPGPLRARSGLNGASWARHLNTELRNLPFPLPPPFLFRPPSVSAQQKAKVWTACLRIKHKALPPISGLVFEKSLSKRLFSGCLWKECYKKLWEKPDLRQSQASLAENTEAIPTETCPWNESCSIPVLKHNVTRLSPTQAYRLRILSLGMAINVFVWVATLLQTARQTQLKQPRRESFIFINSVAKRNSSCLLSLRRSESCNKTFSGPDSLYLWGLFLSAFHRTWHILNHSRTFINIT